MEILDKGLLKYSEAHTAPESDLLKRINRDTHAYVSRPRMLSGHLQGRLLAMMSRLVHPSAILEIGTYTGYSALCLAEGLVPGGTLITIDNNEELETRVRRYFAASAYNQVIDFRVGNALAIIATLKNTVDLVFIDADKENYGHYYDAVIARVSVGGWIIADNVLWSGKVLDERPDKDTRAILDFNQKVQHDDRVENILLPVRDGLMIMRKVRD